MANTNKSGNTVAWLLIDYPTRSADWEVCRWDGRHWVDFNGDAVLDKSILDVNWLEKPVMQEAA